MNNFRPARTAAVANETRQIEASTSRAIAAREDEQRRPRTAIEAMASRLEVSPQTLQNTLKNTVFAGCRSNEEFVALIVVANAYGLNPLTKEIYAFPAKGGGVVPMVSVDGWTKIMNDHPQFDGITFDYHMDDDGKVYAIESIIHRKDRSNPTRTMEFMDECKGNTIPWQKSPKRMLRHRALMQGARIAFGFSGIAAEGDEESIEGEYRPVQSLPSRQSIAEELNDEIPATFDKQTGEVIEDAQDEALPRDEQTGLTEVSEEAARALDAGGYHDEPEAEEEAEGAAEERPAYADWLDGIKAGIAKAGGTKALATVEGEYLKNCIGLPKEVADGVEQLLMEKRKSLSQGGR